jgi:hypothetical protein
MTGECGGGNVALEARCLVAVGAGRCDPNHDAELVNGRDDPRQPAVLRFEVMNRRPVCGRSLAADEDDWAARFRKRELGDEHVFLVTEVQEEPLVPDYDGRRITSGGVIGADDDPRQSRSQMPASARVRLWPPDTELRAVSITFAKFIARVNRDRAPDLAGESRHFDHGLNVVMSGPSGHIPRVVHNDEACSASFDAEECCFAPKNAGVSGALPQPDGSTAEDAGSQPDQDVQERGRHRSSPRYSLVVGMMARSSHPDATAAKVSQRPTKIEKLVQRRFLSLEPWPGRLPSLNLTGIDWVIVGGESGPDHRPLDLGWVREIRDRCADLQVPLFFKQVGERSPKARGRLLDGRTWDEFPSRTSAGAGCG